MSLSNTIAANHIEYQRDAILLSLIPYGIMKKEAAAVFSQFGRNTKRCVDSLERKGYIQRKEITINSKYRKYRQKYLRITGAGIQYLAEKYSDIYPWLSLLAENELVKNNCFSIRSTLNNNRLNLILNCQQGDVFLSESGVETIFERLQSRPGDVAKVISIATRNMPNDYFPKICAGSILDWTNTFGDIQKPSDQDIRFYDFWEINCGSECPYNQNNKSKSGFYVDITKYRLGHIGLIQGRYSNFIVMMSKRDGVQLNPADLSQTHDIVANQMLNLGILPSILDTPSHYQVVVLCNTAGTGVSTFKHAFLDNRNLRPKSTKLLGIGTSATYLVPITSEAFPFALAILNTQNYESTWIRLLSENFNCISRNSMSLEFPLIYKEKPCAFGMSLNALHLNQCLEDQQNKVIICHEWQVPFIRSVLPDILIVGYEPENHSLIEHFPANPQSESAS